MADRDLPIHDSTVENGTSEAARLHLADVIKVDVHFASDASSTMTVEVSNDGHEWFQKDSQSLNDAQDIFEYDVPWEYIRAHTDSNVAKVAISAQ